MAQNTDKFIKVKRRFATEIGFGGFSAGAQTLEIENGTGLDQDTAVVLVISPGGSTEEVVKGVYVGDNTIENCLRGLTGTTDQTHSPGEKVVMYWEEEHVDSMVDGLLEHHNQDGTHKPEAVESLRSTIADMMYPVGSIYINAEDNTNPETLLGIGTWERFGEGRVMVSHDDGDSDFDTAQATGGHKEMHQHNHSSGGLGTSSEGNHSHNGWVFGGGYTRSTISFGTGPTSSSVAQWIHAENSHHNRRATGDLPSGGRVDLNGTTSAGSHSHDISGSTGNAGSGNAGNLQPYIVVYAWKRTE